MLVIALLYLTYKEAVGKPLTLSSATVKKKRDLLESAGTTPTAKYQRFKLESEETLYSWDLLPELASYINR